jgi:hypothetical protein
MAQPTQATPLNCRRSSIWRVTNPIALFDEGRLDPERSRQGLTLVVELLERERAGQYAWGDVTFSTVRSARTVGGDTFSSERRGPG